MKIVYIASFLAKSYVGVPKAIYRYHRNEAGASLHSLDSDERWTLWKNSHAFIYQFLADVDHKQGISDRYPIIQNKEILSYFLVNSYMNQLSFNKTKERFSELCQTLSPSVVLDILSRYYPREKALSFISKNSKKIIIKFKQLLSLLRNFVVMV